FVATVTGPADAPTAFVWIRPVDAPTGPTTGDATGTDGRVDFEWEADDTVADPQAWTSTLTLLQGVPAGWTAQSPIVDCVLDRPDEQQSVVAMNVSIDSPDVTIDRAASYTFPN